MSQKAKLVVMISGNGSNLQALIDACESGRLPAEVVCVISNRTEAYGLKRAEKHAIPARVFRLTGDRAKYDADLGKFVTNLEPDWVILAGWMLILSMNFLRQFPNRVVNLHPALPGQFPGTKAIKRAFEAAQRGKVNQTGVMVHLVPDEGVDTGPVLSTQPVHILPDDTLATLTERIHAVEHQLLVETVHRLIVGEIIPLA